MASDADAFDVLDITTAILTEMDRKGLDPVMCYAALGCAFIQLHQALGHSKEAWMETTRDIGEKNDWSKT